MPKTNILLSENKQKDYISKKKRIKSGEKGIGRFALDRLGNTCDMYTKTETSKKVLHWRVKWSDFEQTDRLLNEIQADLGYSFRPLTTFIPNTISRNSFFDGAE